MEGIGSSARGDRGQRDAALVIVDSVRHRGHADKREPGSRGVRRHRDGRPGGNRARSAVDDRPDYRRAGGAAHRPAERRGAAGRPARRGARTRVGHRRLRPARRARREGGHRPRVGRRRARAKSSWSTTDLAGREYLLSAKNTKEAESVLGQVSGETLRAISALHVTAGGAPSVAPDRPPRRGAAT